MMVLLLFGAVNADAARVETKSYIAGTGDLSAICNYQGQNIGGACFSINGESHLKVTVKDQLGWKVGGWWRLLTNLPGGPTYLGEYCGSFTMDPSRGYQLEVLVGTANSSLMCAPTRSAGTVGTITADFTPPDTGCSAAKAYMPRLVEA